MNTALRPSIRLLDDTLVTDIIDEAMDVLQQVGVYVENTEAIAFLGDAGARIDGTNRRAHIQRTIVERSLATTPHEIVMYDRGGERSYVVGGGEVHFDPGSAGLKLYDRTTGTEREAFTRDLVHFHRLTDRLEHFHFQSTGLISSDVPQTVADAFRLFVALHHCSKPIVTGIFITEGSAVMHEMLAAVRGGSAELRQKPLAIFDACPSPPLKWSNLTAQSVIDCARAGIPSEFVSMPLTGATSPVTITGALVQHVAENLSGLVLAQAVAPGAPVIYGGSPAAFDMRTGMPPMGAIETMMIDCAYSQIGKHLGIPTHAYMGLSDAKSLDAQAGLESGIGAILAALAGINVVSGGGMMDYETCQSLEKLVVDHEICGMAYRLIEGIQQREQPMALNLFLELGDRADFLSHANTVEWLRKDHRFPTIIDRGNYDQWVADGRPTLADRAAQRVDRLLAGDLAPTATPELQHRLREIMDAHTRRLSLPPVPSPVV